MSTLRLASWSLAILLAVAVQAEFAAAGKAQQASVVIPGLQEPVQVLTDRDGILHITAANDLDLARAEGFIHARDRFFQMDVTRREISGDLAELLGPDELGSDIGARTIGLRRAAERTLPTLPPGLVGQLQAYADGVNAYLASNPLPPEYALLELTAARPWDVIDTLTLAKGLAANLSLDIDVGPTFQLQQFIEAGVAGGFDGTSLFFNDVSRSAPLDAAATVPDAGGSPSFLTAKTKKPESTLLARAAAGAERAREKLAKHPLFAAAMERREFQIGSNEWGVSAEKSKLGRPLIANDPHLSLNIPATFYEWRLQVTDDPQAGPMNVSGVSFPGAPGVVLGQNENVTWGATTNGLDVSDVFQDHLEVLTPNCVLLGAIACIQSEGVFHRVDIEITTYFFNVIGDGVSDNLQDAGLPFEQTLIATVPFRSFGPILDIEDPSVLPGGGITTALVLQFTGFHPTQEVQSFLKWNRAQNLDDFLEGLADFDFGAQNWAYADKDGNLAYFSSGEAPLRKDLEQGTVIGFPPVFIRDGSGGSNWVPDPARSQGQAIPFAILPFDEMPQLVNPPNGFFVNANNDPAGTTLDNDPLNQVRSSNPGALYYLAPGYANGLRAGRITRLIQQQLDAGKKLSDKDMMRFQANTQQLDAELLTPFLLNAFDSASAPGAPADLAALAADADVAEAIGRLGEWDFSTPTGIPEGWDASDPPGAQRGGVPTAEQKASVAATIYNLWRGKIIRRVIDDTLAGFGLGVGSSDALKALHHLLTTEPFTGLSTAQDVDFFPEPAGLSAEERRDATLLAALRDALDALASDEFAPAFGNSTNQDDYRWGKLHRITFDHEFNPAFSIPPAAGFADLAPDLPGLSRDGGFEVVNASGFSARADGLNDFRFGGGPVRRYVGIGDFPGLGGGNVRGFNVIPGGPSGDPNSPLYANQLATWLSADYHTVVMSDTVAGRNAIAREVFVPGP
jgi:penicillin amidase